MLINKRPDGKPAKVPGYTKIVPHLMPTRSESVIFMEQMINLEKTLPFIRTWNEEKSEDAWPLTIMQILLAAAARTVGERPRLNRFVSNRRHYQRNNISASFVAKKTLSDDGVETNVIMPFQPDDNLADVNARFAEYLGTAKSDEGNKTDSDVDLFEKLPHWILRAFVSFYRFLDKRNWLPKAFMQMLPFYVTVFMTNVGSLGIDAPFHHNFEIGTTGLFVALGKIKNEKVISEKGEIVDRSQVKITYTFDDRIVDGIYSGRAMELLKSYIENPERLVDKPQVDPKNLEELALTEEGWKLWARK